MPKVWSDRRDGRPGPADDGPAERGTTPAAAPAWPGSAERAGADPFDAASRPSFGALAASQRSGFDAQAAEAGRTRDQMYAEAIEKNIPGRSSMTKAELARALRRHG
jgi:hypothetical protein